MYVYVKSEPQLWTVGYYDLKGQWHAESDHSLEENAARRVAYLNGYNHRWRHELHAD